MKTRFLNMGGPIDRGLCLGMDGARGGAPGEAVSVETMETAVESLSTGLDELGQRFSALTDGLAGVRAEREAAVARNKELNAENSSLRAQLERERTVAESLRQDLAETEQARLQVRMGVVSAGEMAAIVAGESVLGQFWVTDGLQADLEHGARRWEQRILAGLEACYGDEWMRMADLFFRSLRVNDDSNIIGTSEAGDRAMGDLVTMALGPMKRLREARRAVQKLVHLAHLSSSGAIDSQYVRIKPNFEYTGIQFDPASGLVQTGTVSDEFVIDAMNDSKAIAIESEEIEKAVAQMITLLSGVADMDDVELNTTERRIPIAVVKEARRFINQALMHREHIIEEGADKFELHVVSRTEPSVDIQEAVFTLFANKGILDCVRIVWYSTAGDVTRVLNPTAGFHTRSRSSVSGTHRIADRYSGGRKQRRAQRLLDADRKSQQARRSRSTRADGSASAGAGIPVEQTKDWRDLWSTVVNSRIDTWLGDDVEAIAAFARKAITLGDWQRLLVQESSKSIEERLEELFLRYNPSFDDSDE